MNKTYRQQVELLLKIIPTLSGIDSFAIHGGTAINLYVLDLPRYSVDIDVTYTPIKPREESFAEIHKNLSILKEKIKAIIPNVIVTDFEQVKKGFLYCLLGGDRPIIESLSPNKIDQQETMIKQFSGMTDIPFSYNDYEETREKLIDFINSNLTRQDKEFFIAFEAGNDLVLFAEYQEYLKFPSVQWKLQNINKLKEINQIKHRESVKKIENYLMKK